MIDRTDALPVTCQAAVLELSRSSVYYTPAPVPEGDLTLMRRMDESHLEYPFAGARMLRDLLWREGVTSGRKRIARLMKAMGIEALYRKPNTSCRHPEHVIYSYRLRELAINRPNQVWAMDISVPQQAA